MLPRYGLEKAVIDELVEHCLQPVVLQQLMHDLRQDTFAQQAMLTAQLAEPGLRLKGMKKSLDNLTRAIEEGGHTPALLTRLQTLEMDRLRLEAEIEQGEQKLGQGPDEIEEAEMLETAAALRHALQKGDDETRREILLGVVKKAVVEGYGKQMVGNVWFYLPTARTLKRNSPDGAGELDI